MYHFEKPRRASISAMKKIYWNLGSLVLFLSSWPRKRNSSSGGRVLFVLLASSSQEASPSSFENCSKTLKQKKMHPRIHLRMSVPGLKKWEGPRRSRLRKFKSKIDRSILPMKLCTSSSVLRSDSIHIGELVNFQSVSHKSGKWLLGS